MAGFGDLMKLMSHAKELQESARKLKDELPQMEFSGSGANGCIQVTVSGDLTVRKISIAPEMLNDREYLESELTAVFNDVITSARGAMQEKMQAVAGSLGIDLPSF